jgi:outer membrane protein TolC
MRAAWRWRAAGSASHPLRTGLVLAAVCLLIGATASRADESVEIPLKAAGDAPATVKEVQPPAATAPALDTDDGRPISASEPDLKPIDLEGLLAPSTPDELVKFLAQNYQPGDQELSLEDAIALALKNNHGLNQQRLTAEAAVQDVKVNWTALRPQLSASGKGSWSWTNSHSAPQVINIPGQAPITIGGQPQQTGLVENLTLSLTQRIYDFGLTTNLIDLAKARLAIQHYAVSAAEQQLVDQVTVSYLDYNLALGQARIRWDELRLAEEALREAQAQFNAGSAPRLDVIRAQSAVEEAHGGVIQAETQFGNAAAQFFSLLGVEDQRYVPLLIPAEYLQLGDAPPAVDDAVKQALDNRPELDLQRSSLLAGQEAAKLTSNRPIISAFGNWGYTMHTGAEGPYNTQWGVQIQWPVYTGGKDKVDRKQADIEIAGISEGILDLQAKIELDATSSWNQLFAARNQADVAQRDLALSAEALRAAFIGYQAGVTRYIDLRDAMDNNVGAALNYLGALANVRLANIDLQRAEGFPHGYPDDSRPDFDPATPVEQILGIPAPDAKAAMPAQPEAQAK